MRVYANGLDATDGKASEFTVALDWPRRAAGLDLRFHWRDYPRTFSLEGMTSSGWVTLLEEERWEPQGIAPVYSAAIESQEPLSAVRFTANDFSGQPRLLLDYFSIREPSSGAAALKAWRSVADMPAMEYMGANAILDEIAANNAEADYATANARLLDALAGRLAASGAEVRVCGACWRTRSFIAP